MRKWFYICILLAAGAAACSDDKPGVTEPPLPPEPEQPADTIFWDKPHTCFMGLEGKVMSCVRSGYDDEGIEAERMTLEFDSCGHLIHYDPLGLGVLQFAMYETVWLDPTVYRYEYNKEGQLVKITQETMGEEARVYELEYGTHGSYVPLPLPLGTHAFFLVKDLIKLEGPDLQYSCDGKKAVCITDSWMGTTTVKYAFDGNYPLQATEVIARGEDTSRLRVIGYQFDGQGRLLSSSVHTTYPGEEGYDDTEITYLPDFCLLPVMEVVRIEGEGVTRYTSSYDAAGNLLSRNVTRGEEEENEESWVYPVLDDEGNWIVAERKIPGLGVMEYKREIKYKGK